MLAILLLTVSTARSGSPMGLPNRRVQIYVLSVFNLGDEDFGACSPVSIWYDKTNDQRTRIAFVEDEIDGYGEMWRPRPGRRRWWRRTCAAGTWRACESFKSGAGALTGRAQGDNYDWGACRPAGRHR
ncbi:hypothetical protein [Posidoniimonas polymericola]|nr:hypothetical protein [Posidoniimonas polymericola]